MMEVLWKIFFKTLFSVCILASFAFGRQILGESSQLNAFFILQPTRQLCFFFRTSYFLFLYSQKTFKRISCVFFFKPEAIHHLKFLL